MLAAKECPLCGNSYYTTVESYAVHLRSLGHTNNLKGIEFSNIKFQRDQCSLRIIGEYHRYFILLYMSEIFNITMDKYIIQYIPILGKEHI